MANLTLTGILAIALGEFFLQCPYTITTTSIRNAIVAPHRWPLIGNALDMPTHQRSEGFYQWALKYSEDYVFCTPVQV